ncbi:MAG: leucine-rich repeat protein [Clostridia bacterium]|nr:leucine-rich repeat protein [Clostridia bacterium]
MKRYTKMIAFLLIICNIVSLFCVPISAEDHTHTAEDIITEMPTADHFIDDVKIVGYESRYAARPADAIFTDTEDAILYLREQMKVRAENVSIRINGKNLSASEISALYNDALAHTGVGNEGDYIKHHRTSVSYTYTNGEDENGLYFQIDYTMGWLSTPTMEAEMNTAVDSLLNELDLWNKSDYEKVRGIYDYICGNVKYDHDYESKPDNYEHTAYNALVKNLAVCQGYATLLYRLLLTLGVDCRYIRGWGQGYIDGENHAWNIVRLNGVYYNLDATWDAGITVYYRYFLCTNENFPNHTPDSEYTSTAWKTQYPPATVPYGVEAEASGTLTNTMTWYLEKNGTLTITGTGRMPDFKNLGAPWYPYIDSITKIVLSEGITTVGSYAFVRCKNAASVVFPSTLKEIHTYGFDNCRALKTLNLPDGLVRIDRMAFAECMALTSVTLPDTVTTVDGSIFSNDYNLRYVKLSAGMTSIPDSMFFNTDSLQTVIIPDGITRIEDTVFRGCDGLTSITIPKQISYIGVAAFADCKNLKNIYVDDANPYFCDVNGILFSKDMKTLINYPGGRMAPIYTVPKGVTKLAYASFGTARHLYYVDFPDTLTTIDTYSFAWCQNLREITLGKNITKIGNTAFGFCENLEKVTFENQNITFGSMDWSIFLGCNRLTEIVLPSNMKSIPTGFFDDCWALTDIPIPETVSAIGSSAFSYCKSLTSMTIPQKVGRVESSTFTHCTNLERVTFMGNISHVDYYAFDTCSNISVIRFAGTVGTFHQRVFDDTILKTVYFDNQSAVNKITSQSAYNGILLKNIRTIGVNTKLASVPNYIKNNFTYTTVIDYEGERYTLYSDHAHDWWYNGGMKCTICKAIKEPHTHQYTSAEVTPPTCLSRGYTTYTCVCGYSYTGDYVSATGHIYTGKVTPATCIEQGYTTYTCTCGDMYLSDYVTPKGHTWDSGKITKEPTEESTGIRTYTCTECSTTRTEVIPMLTHTHKHTATVTAPTCTAQGYTTYTCPCGDSYISDYVDANGHSFGNWTQTKAPTCTEKGEEKQSCSVCESIETREIAAKGHSYAKQVTAPTCTEKGYTTYTCPCGDSYVSDYVSAKGHSYTAKVTEPTCTEKGYTTYTCSCGDSYIKDEKNALGHTFDNDADEFCNVCGESRALRGDMNGDNSKNAADAIYLLRHIIMPALYPINQSGDVNGDGAVNAADAVYLLRHTIMPSLYPLKNGGN